MSGNLIAGSIPVPRVCPVFRSQIRSLVWEEAHVAGSIAGVCGLIAAVLLAQFRWMSGPDAWAGDGDNIGLFLASVPVIVSLLLILRTDYSEHLAGGFSERILRLPVPVWAAVGAVLLVRTAILAVTAFALLAVSQYLFRDTLSVGFVPAVAAFYVAVQTLDWLRAPIRGLTSLVLLAAGTCIILYFPFRHAIEINLDSAGAWILPAVFIGPAYLLSIVAVHATRVGLHTGVPEIWEWPRHVSMRLPARVRPFASPFTAQVWFDIRRTFWVMPAVTAVLFGLFAALIWMFLPRDSGVVTLDNVRVVQAFGLLGIFFLAAAAHGAFARIAPFRFTPGKVNHHYLHPLTADRFALARVVANAIQLTGTLALVMALHYYLIGQMFFGDVVPRVLAVGGTTYREVALVFVARTFAVALVAWLLMAADTSTVYWLLCGLVVAFVAGIIPTIEFGEFWTWTDESMLAMTMLFTAGAFARALHQRRIAARSLLAWLGVWAVVAMQLLLLSRANPLNPVAIVTALGLGALVPLPYIAYVRDIHRVRHGRLLRQDGAQHANTSSTMDTPTRLGLCAAIVGATALITWAGWPVVPSYIAYMHDKNLPATPLELDRWYADVPADRNMALRYLAIGNPLQQRVDDFRHALAQNRVTEIGLFGNNAAVQTGQPITDETWVFVEARWQNIDAAVAVDLRAAAAADTGEARYPIEFYDGRWNYGHCQVISNLANSLRVDVLHPAISRDAANAAESIAAMLPLADSALFEPSPNTQFARTQILGGLVSTLEDTMSRVVLRESDLAIIEAAMAKSHAREKSIDPWTRAYIGQTVLDFEQATRANLSLTSFLENRYRLNRWTSADIFGPLVFPLSGDQIVRTYYLDARLEATGDDQLPQAWRSDRNSVGPLFGFAPLTIMDSASSTYYVRTHGQVRLMLALARTAIALERHRIAYGSLPQTLADLDPAFAPAIQESVTFNINVNGDGGYEVVWLPDESIAEPYNDMRYDARFTVAPTIVREGPQVTMEDAS